MKYNKNQLKSSYPDTDFVFFWGHTPAKSGEITQSCLSQWWKCDFTEGGINFCCAEQYMMYRKALLFEDHEHADDILKTKDPKTIKALGRLVSNFDDKVWNEHKSEIVLQGNICKFSQNPELKAYLIGTGDRILVEASPYDRVWGDRHESRFRWHLCPAKMERTEFARIPVDGSKEYNKVRFS